MPDIYSPSATTPPPISPVEPVELDQLSKVLISPSTRSHVLPSFAAFLLLSLLVLDLLRSANGFPALASYVYRFLPTSIGLIVAITLQVFMAAFAAVALARSRWVAWIALPHNGESRLARATRLLFADPAAAAGVFVAVGAHAIGIALTPSSRSPLLHHASFRLIQLSLLIVIALLFLSFITSRRLTSRHILLTARTPTQLDYHIHTTLPGVRPTTIALSDDSLRQKSVLCFTVSPHGYTLQHEDATLEVPAPGISHRFLVLGNIKTRHLTFTEDSERYYKLECHLSCVVTRPSLRSKADYLLSCCSIPGSAIDTLVTLFHDDQRLGALVTDSINEYYDSLPHRSLANIEHEVTAKTSYIVNVLSRDTPLATSDDIAIEHVKNKVKAAMTEMAQLATKLERDYKLSTSDIRRRLPLLFQSRLRMDVASNLGPTEAIKQHDAIDAILSCCTFRLDITNCHMNADMTRIRQVIAHAFVSLGEVYSQTRARLETFNDMSRGLVFSMLSKPESAAVFRELADNEQLLQAFAQIVPNDSIMRKFFDCLKPS